MPKCTKAEALLNEDPLDVNASPGIVDAEEIVVIKSVV